MGVPKFFRYTSERYPCLNELVKQYQIPEFDNMYLDMNGIIHNCSHPDDSNPHFRITEEKIFLAIFHYISILFQIIKPRRLFFMAIDGVAPRAKMNQQRGRRFRSAREAEQLEQKAREKGETLPSESRFDSNCITPGTVFMARLHAQLRYFIKDKITNDPLWGKCRVILSGHETPGEGEHKIMDYIRWARSQPDYDPDTRHCLYGLDADLIMLGMCTHEPHFALLREEVKFGKSTQRATSPEETNFYLLHLSLMRDYLEQEFLSVKESLPFEWDLEKIVDDWVLMGFLVGNDFIPNLPNMHISNDALPLLYKTYMAVLPTLDGYINEAGVLHLGRFETFMQELAKIDKDAFQETYADLRYFVEKTGRRPNPSERKEYKPNDDETFNVNVEAIKSGRNDDLQALINATDDMLLGCEDDGDEEYEDMSDEETNFNMEFVLHKRDYYINKLDYAKVTPEVLASQAECYVRAIQWNLHYYYRGCASWCWFYPHHYAPYISDIKGFRDLNIQFELGEPFKPFEQLLAVLPAASKALLPEPFHALMTEDNSPIFDYYPVNFETDLNGKKNDWEAVVLIPFIDEKKLLSAMEPCYKQLSPEEAQRNTHGPMLVYNYTHLSLGEVAAPEYFPAVRECHCSESSVWRAELHVPPERLRRGVLPGAHTRLYFQGFPTMRHMHYKVAAPEYFPAVRECHCSESSVWRAELHVPPERLRRGVLPGAHTRLYFQGFPTMRHMHYKVLSLHSSLSDEVAAPEYFPAVRECHCSESSVWRAELHVPPERLRRGVLPGAHTRLYFQGFPTMRHMHYKVLSLHSSLSDKVAAPEYFPAVRECHCSESSVWRAELHVPPERLRRGVLPGAHTRLYFQGFPTMRHMHYKVLSLHSSLSDEVAAPEYFPAVRECHCSESSVWRAELHVPPERLRRGVLPGAHTRLYFQGFPTMRHMHYKTYVKKSKCRVFDQPSRNENMIVQLLRAAPEPALEQAARDLLGRVVWVGWPHLTQAKVISVSNEKQRLHCSTSGDGGAAPYTVERNEGNLHKQWLCERSTILDHNMGRMGLDLGEVNIIVHAVNLKGHKYLVQNSSLSVERVWCEVPCGYAYQAVLPEVQHMSVGVHRHSTPEEAFPPGAGVFLVTGPYYGCLAQVVSAESVARSGRVKVQVTEGEEPRAGAGGAGAGGAPAAYRTAHHAAANCGITTQMLSRLTGCVFVVLGEKNNMPTETQSKINIGLNLKFNRKNQEVSGYTRRCGTTNTWLYSHRCVELVGEYIRTYPELVDALSCTIGNDVFFEGELWPGQVGAGKPQEVSDWLKRQPHASAARRDCGSEALEPEEMLQLANSIDQQLAASKPMEKKVTLQVKISLLYMPELHEGNISPDPKANFQLYDRVICATNNLTVPLGAKGTITAIYNTPPANTVRLSDKLNSEPSYQILFDKPFAGAMTEEMFPEPRFYRLSGCHLLNISYGRKLRERNGHAAHDPYQPQILSAATKPNQLRSNDGHHSAFASYTSPTKDKQSPNNFSHSPAHPSLDYQEQDGTELLKSLLKISQPSSGNEVAASNDNWRIRSNNTSSRAQRATHRDTQSNMSNPIHPFWMMFGAQAQGSWRSDSSKDPARGARPAPPPAPASAAAIAWNPSLLHNNTAHYSNKKDVVAPPFPNFSQPPPLPPFPFQLPPPPRPPPFAHAAPPAHPAPGWPFVNQIPGERTVAAAAAAEEPPAAPALPVHTPFVPLQVVAKHRRVQKPSGPANREATEGATQPAAHLPAAAPPPRNDHQASSEPHTDAGSKPKRRTKKSRIGANLPLQ